MTWEIRDIYRYPVKGLSPEPLDEALLVAGEGILHDRRFAIAPGSTPPTQNTGGWIAKNFFLMLARNPKLAQLTTEFDTATDTLTVLRRGKPVSKGKLTDPIGRTMIEDFFSAFMGEEARGRLSIFEARNGKALTDQSQPLISLINLKSVNDIGRVTGGKLEPARFRGNIYFDAPEPWQETDLIGRAVTIGDARLQVIAPIGRCMATHVNPVTAERDVNILKALQSGFHHTNCGVFAEVITGGTIRNGDKIST
ncbi:MAG: MOSC domain-containing protein [Rhodospirillales bacterium]|nr:MOSC domain-containing protein [Rhodospirillales bacterium]